jgi:cytochrome bd-type quinol oxidase subunit 2
MAYNAEEWLHDDVRNRPRSRSARWWLLAALLAAIGGVIAAPFYGGAQNGEQFIALPLAVLSVIGLYLSPFSRDLLIGDQNAHYDEHEQLILLKASQKAFRLMVLLMLIFATWCWAGADGGVTAPRRAFDFSALFSGILWGITTLPVLLAEWSLPLPKPGEDD